MKCSFPGLHEMVGGLGGAECSQVDGGIGGDQNSPLIGDASGQTVRVGSKGRESPMVFLKGSMGAGRATTPCGRVSGANTLTADEPGVRFE